MKGQFMIISAVVIGLILLSTASTVSEIQNREFEAETSGHRLNELKSEVSKIDTLDKSERKRFRKTMENYRGYDTKVKYWNSQNCFNITLENSGNRFQLNCVGRPSPGFKVLLNLDTKNEFDANGVYNSLRAGTSSGELRIGYLNGNTGDDLVGYWRLDSTSGTVKDYSGNGNDGTNYGAERGVTGVFSTNGVKVPDDQDVINVSNDPSLSGMNEITVSAWLKEEGDPGSNYAHIVSKSTTSGDNDYGIIQQSGGDIVFRVNTDNGDYDDDNANAGTIPRDTWVHIVGTWNETANEIRIYKNGQLADTQSEAGNVKDGNGPLGIGKHGISMNNRYFNGSIDEIRIYNRTLSPSEIKQLYFHGLTGDFRGNYTANNLNIDPNYEISKIEVNSDIASSTSGTIEIDHSSGATDTINLDSGYKTKNYSVSIPSGGLATLKTTLKSSDEELSPLIRSMKVWISN